MVRTTEELAKQAEAGRGHQSPPAKTIPDNAIGNGAKIVVSENQTPINFDLRPPQAN